MNAALHAPVEDALAEIQEIRAGLRDGDPAALERRVAEVRARAAHLGMARFLDGLLQAPDAPDVSHAFMEIDADEPTRVATHHRWRDAAEQRLPSLWQWMCGVRARGWQRWWCRDLEPALHAETIERLATTAPPVKPIGHIARAWAAEAGVARATALPTWRWLALGRGLNVRVPLPADLLRAQVAALRERGLLPAGHRVQLVRRVNRPSMVMPVRVPGASVLFVPTAGPPLALQYTLHELAHLAEHALRPPDAPLVDRWRFDIVRSEGLALLFERLVQVPSWLRRFGVAADDAVRLAEFFREEEAFTRGMLVADVALDERLALVTTLDEAVAAAAEIARALDLEIDPAILLFRVPGMLNWRAYVAAWPWRDAAVASLEARFGREWHDEPGAWDAIRTVMASVGDAGAALRTLSLGANPRAAS